MPRDLRCMALTSRALSSNCIVWVSVWTWIHLSWYYTCCNRAELKVQNCNSGSSGCGVFFFAPPTMNKWASIMAILVVASSIFSIHRHRRPCEPLCSVRLSTTQSYCRDSVSISSVHFLAQLVCIPWFRRCDPHMSICEWHREQQFYNNIV